MSVAPGTRAPSRFLLYPMVCHRFTLLLPATCRGRCIVIRPDHHWSQRRVIRCEATACCLECSLVVHSRLTCLTIIGPSDVLFVVWRQLAVLECSLAVHSGLYLPDHFWSQRRFVRCVATACCLGSVRWSFTQGLTFRGHAPVIWPLLPVVCNQSVLVSLVI